MNWVQPEILSGGRSVYDWWSCQIRVSIDTADVTLGRRRRHFGGLRSSSAQMESSHPHNVTDLLNQWRVSRFFPFTLFEQSKRPNYTSGWRSANRQSLRLWVWLMSSVAENSKWGWISLTLVLGEKNTDNLDNCCLFELICFLYFCLKVEGRWNKLQKLVALEQKWLSGGEMRVSYDDFYTNMMRPYLVTRKHISYKIILHHIENYYITFSKHISAKQHNV